MSHYLCDIYQLACDALNDLEVAQSSGRIPANPLSETHYLAAWLTSAIKNKRYHSNLLPILKTWQHQARSLGKNAGLVKRFVALKSCYTQLSDSSKHLKPVCKQQIVQFCDFLSKQGWKVDIDLVVSEKFNRPSKGQDSLIICHNQLDDCFNQTHLIKPISIYIRGNLALAIKAAMQANLLLYKITDYKSKVKYHGEYLLHVNNSGTSLPELMVI